MLYLNLSVIYCIAMCLLSIYIFHVLSFYMSTNLYMCISFVQRSTLHTCTYLGSKFGVSKFGVSKFGVSKFGVSKLGVLTKFAQC